MTITLPLPPKSLSPNGRVHWKNKARLTKHARTNAKLITLAALNGSTPFPYTHYALTFYYPTRARRDDDNCLASCKAYRDGIADALRIDDHRLSLCEAPVILADPLNPRVEFHLKP